MEPLGVLTGHCLLTSAETKMNRAEVKNQHDMLTCRRAVSKPGILPHLRREAPLLFHRHRWDGLKEGILHEQAGPLGSSLNCAPEERSCCWPWINHVTLGAVAIWAIIFSPSHITFSIDFLPLQPSSSAHSWDSIKYLCILGCCVFPTERTSSYG